MRISAVSVMICSEIILSSELNFIENARVYVQHDEFVNIAYLTGLAICVNCSYLFFVKDALLFTN